MARNAYDQACLDVAKELKDSLELAPFSLKREKAAKLRLIVLAREFPQILEWDSDEQNALGVLLESAAFGNDSQFSKMIALEIWGYKSPDDIPAGKSGAAGNAAALLANLGIKAKDAE